MDQYLLSTKDCDMPQDEFVRRVECFTEVFPSLRVLSYAFNAAIVRSNDATIDALRDQNPDFEMVGPAASMRAIEEDAVLDESFEHMSLGKIQARIEARKNKGKTP